MGNVTAVYVNAETTSQKHRGKILGILASGFGLSPTLVSLIYFGLFHTGRKELYTFFFTLAFVVFIVCFIGALIFDYPKKLNQIKNKNQSQLPLESNIQILSNDTDLLLHSFAENILFDKIHNLLVYSKLTLWQKLKLYLKVNYFKNFI
eukprot:c8282_g1_i1.p1 GENE.c8282_g1_i1~~c8282_g1_i1.p1  ORF type:complete len:149 (+),score=30.51 c8282_g1_i1:344-790(+)